MRQPEETAPGREAFLALVERTLEQQIRAQEARERRFAEAMNEAIAELSQQKGEG